MRLRLMALISGVILLGALVGGATFALFTDSESSSATFEAGTVAVEIHSDSGEVISDADGPPLMNISGMAPGDPESVYFAKVHNSGSLPFTYNLSFFYPIGMSADPNDLALADALMMKVERETGPGAWETVGEMSVSAWDLLGATADMPVLDAGLDHRFRLTVWLPLATGNDAQDGNVQVSFQVNATQLTGAPPAACVTPGTDFATACALAANTPVSSQLDANANHYYKIWLEAGQTATATVTVNEPDPDLFVYNPLEIYIGQSWLGGNATDSFTFTAATTGFHYLRVNAWWGDGPASYNLSWN